jgi:hypothetical protein
VSVTNFNFAEINVTIQYYDQKNIIMKFLGNVLATIIGLFIFHVVLRDTNCRGSFGGDSEAITVKNNSVIVLNLEDIKYDYAGKYEPVDLYFCR